MANQKTYVIQINGVEESIKSVSALTEKIANLQKTINEVAKNKISIPVEIGNNMSALIQEIQDFKNKVKASTKDALPIADEREYAKALKERNKQLEAVNRTLGDTNKNQAEFKQETKDMVAEATKARNEAQGYANTLNGLKKELKDLNNYKGNLDLGSDEYKKVSERIYELNSQLKALESAQGSYGRNVGNYANSIKEAADEFDRFNSRATSVKENIEEVNEKFRQLGDIDLNPSNLKQYGITINDLRTRIGELKRIINNTPVGGDAWKEANRELVKLQTTLAEVEKGMRGVGNETTASMNKIKISVNGVDYEFNGINRAVQGLSKELQSMAAMGKQDTEEFKNLAEALRKFKQETKYTQAQIVELTKTDSSLTQMIETFQGFSSIAAIGQGVGGFFGMDDAESQKKMQSMMSLIAILEGVRGLQTQMKENTGFGQMLTKWNAALDNFLKKLVSFQATFNNISNMMKGTNKSDFLFFPSQILDNFDRAIAASSTLTQNFNQLKKEAEALGASGDGLVSVYSSIIGEIVKLNNEETRLSALGQTLSADDDQRRTSLEKLRDSVEKFIMSVSSSTKTVYTFKDGLKTVGAQLKVLASSCLNTIKGIVGVGTSTQQSGNQAQLATRGYLAMGTAMQGAAMAAKLLKATLKALIIFAVIEFVMELIEGIKDATVAIGRWIVGNSNLVNSLDSLESHLDSTDRTLNKFIEDVDRDVANGLITSVDGAAKKLDILEQATKNAIKELKEFNDLNEELKAKALSDNYNTDDTWFSASINSMEEFKKHFEDLRKAVESGVDVSKVNGGSSNNPFSAQFWRNLWFTADDAKADLAEAQKAVIADIENRINHLDLSKGKKELDSFFKIINSEMYQASIKNLENLYPEQEWAKVLKRRLEAVRDMYEQMDDAAKASADAQIAEQKRIAAEAEANAKTVRDNNTEAISDPYKRQLEEIKNSRADEIKAANGNKEIIASINRKYDRIERDAIKAHNEQIQREREQAAAKAKSAREKAANDAKRIAEALANALKRIRDNELAAEEESVEKKLKLIENQRDDELEAAKKMEINAETMEKLILSINVKYDALIEREKARHLDFLNRLSEDYLRRQKAIQQDLNALNLTAATNTMEDNHNTRTNTSEGNFDFDAMYGERIEAEKRFNEERLQIELDYLTQKANLDRVQIGLDYSNQLESEKQRFKDALAQLQNYVKNGELTQEEYNAFVEKENEIHASTLENIEKQKADKILAVNNKLANDKKTLTSKSLREEIQFYTEYESELQDILSNASSKTNAFGVISFSKTRQSLKEAQGVIKEGLKKIQDEYKNLDDKLKDKQITFADYKEAKKQLKETEKTLQKEGKSISKALSSLLEQVANEWKQTLDQWVGQVSGLLNTLNDTQMQLIDNQLAIVDHELEIAEQAYDKAEEAAERHKDKMNDIEDELANARGSRRQFLIDTLAEQQNAYLEDLAAQEKAAQEKERLEAKQKKLEKQRQEQEKKAKVQQAIINTYTAVSNALSVSPWFVGVALSALALGLGMANVAAIRNTPIYEDGGVIQGKRHSQGGVKVLGGQAEVEGGEFITNRRSTAKNLGLLEYINDSDKRLTMNDLADYFTTHRAKLSANATSRKFANGGQLPTVDTDEIRRITEVINVNQEDRPIVVSVVDIVNAQDNLRRVQTLSGLK